MPSQQSALLQCKQPSVFPSGSSGKFKIGAYFGLTNLSAIISQPVLLFKHHEIPQPVNSSCPPNQPLRPIAFLNCFQLCYGGQREEDFHFKSKQWKDTNVAETNHPGNYPHFPLHPAYELHKYIWDTYFEIWKQKHAQQLDAREKLVINFWWLWEFSSWPCACFGKQTFSQPMGLILKLSAFENACSLGEG